MATYYIAYDASVKRPGCALIQAAMGGTLPARKFNALFSSELWLVSPTPNMHLYPISDKLLSRLAQITDEAAK